MSSLHIPWLALVQSKKRLDREKGLQQLQESVNEGRLGEEERREGERVVSDLVTSLTSPWEAKHGGLMAAKVLLPGASPQFMGKLKGEVPLLLEYDESRVRLAAGEPRQPFHRRLRNAKQVRTFSLGSVPVLHGVSCGC